MRGLVEAVAFVHEYYEHCDRFGVASAFEPDALENMRGEARAVGELWDDQHNALALVDKLHADLAEVTRERDALRARVAELETHEVEVSRIIGIVDEAAEQLHDALRARIAELGAPPVVPEGWEVERNGDDSWLLWWAPEHSNNRVAIEANRHTGIQCVINNLSCPAEAIGALLCAHRTGERPPHAGDEKVRE